MTVDGFKRFSYQILMSNVNEFCVHRETILDSITIEPILVTRKMIDQGDDDNHWVYMMDENYIAGLKERMTLDELKKEIGLDVIAEKELKEEELWEYQLWETKNINFLKCMRFRASRDVQNFADDLGMIVGKIDKVH